MAIGRPGWLRFTVAVMACVAAPSSGDDWPFFRGPMQDGVSRETGWAEQVAAWGKDGPTIAWRKEVGVGSSSVVVVGDRLVTMGNVAEGDTKDEAVAAAAEDVVVCLDPATGAERWAFRYPCPWTKRQFEGGTASTPTICGDRVYTLSEQGHLHCLNLADGSLVWRKHLVDDFGGKPGRWAYAGSPLVEGDLLVLDIGGAEKSTIAIDRHTGEKVWGTPIGKAGPGSDRAAYATAIAVERHGRREVVVFKATTVVGLDAGTGEERWRIPWKSSLNASASSPIAIEGRLFLSTGWDAPGSGRGALFRLTEAGVDPVWQNDDIKTTMNTAVAHNGHVYCVSHHKRLLMCVSLANGETVWSEPGVGGKHGTLIGADGRLIILSDGGMLTIAEASAAGYEPLASARVFRSRSWVQPVLANGRVFCRSNKGELVCIDVRPAAQVRVDP